MIFDLSDIDQLNNFFLNVTRKKLHYYYLMTSAIGRVGYAYSFGVSGVTSGVFVEVNIARWSDLRKSYLFQSIISYP